VQSLQYDSLDQKQTQPNLKIAIFNVLKVIRRGQLKVKCKEMAKLWVRLGGKEIKKSCERIIKSHRTGNYIKA
jgi:hypothetical protein